MLKALFAKQQVYLNSFFEQVDAAAAEKVLDQISACRGTVIFSGVGKSGHIAEKVSATFMSIGVRSLFLPPANALHGDVGFVSKEDLFIAFSKSGETEELLALLPHIKKKGASTIAVVSRVGSRLSKLSELTMILPVEKELCPLDLAPTTSTTAQLIFGDCLAIGLMEKKRFSMDGFAANHPGGLLGRKITLKVADLMLKGDAVPMCKKEDLLIDVLHILSAKRCGCLLVVDEAQKLSGIFTDGDLRRAIEMKGSEALKSTVAELMTRAPKTITPELLAQEALRKMEETQRVTVLPVLERDVVVGLLHMHDIVG
jgi:arabinose-5-phosphate isomerase